MEQAFYPDRARFFRPFDLEFSSIQPIAQRAGSMGMRAMPAIYLAWNERRDDDDASRELKQIGRDDFRSRFVRALDDAQTGIQTIIDKFVPDFRDVIDPIDEVGSCNDPVILFDIVDGGLDQRDHHLDRMARIEAMRKLAIASQFLAIGAVDPFEDVTTDLTAINFLARRRLFEAIESRQELVCFVLNEEKHNHLDLAYEISIGRRDFGELPSGLRQVNRPITCRTVLDGDRGYLVQTHSRPKSRISAVIKLERGGSLNDRRALRHVLVAVVEGGCTRAATRDDVQAFIELARKRLWFEELREEQDLSLPNAWRNADYWDMKLVGRYYRTPTELFLPCVEHQVTCLVDYLNTEYATDRLGHLEYRRKVVREIVLSKWFPQKWYGIDWKTAF